jgi:hypothetical protein
MGEAVVVNVALMLRVLLVGGIFLILPHITRKGLLFGVYVGEALADRATVRRLVGDWHLGCVILMVLSLLIGFGISLAGRPLAGNLTGTATLLLGGLGLYLRFHSRARGLALPVTEEQGKKATAPLVGGEPKGAGLAKLALGLCLLTSLAAFVYAMVSYEGLWSDRSLIRFMFVPSLNLVLSPFFALLALLTANAKRSVRSGSGGRSVEAQDAFRATNANLLSWFALLNCAFMTILSMEIVRIRLSGTSSLGGGFWLMVGVMAGIVVVFALFNLIRILKRYGQGGALIERGSVDAPLTDGLADNVHWVWGLFYVDRDDPSIMVEKRFGFGYTFNYGNRTAILIVATFLVLILSLIALGLFGTLGGSGQP